MIQKKLKALLDGIKGNHFTSRLMKNVLVSFIGEGGAAVITFITIVALIATIGTSQYGLLTVANTYILIVDSIINFQSWQAVVKFGSEDIEHNNISSLEKLIKVCSVVDMSTAFLGGIASIILAPIIIQFMGWDTDIFKCIYILSIQIFFNFTGTSVGVIRLLDKFKYYSIYRIFSETVRLVLVIVFCGFLNYGIWGAAISFTISYIAGYLLFILFFLKVLREDSRLSLKRILRCKIDDKWREVLGFTMWTNLTMSADIPVQQFDVMFLSLISNEMVAVFKVYKQIGAVLTRLMTPVKQAIMPLYSELVAKNKYKECYEYQLKMKNKILQLLIPIILLTTFMGTPLLGLLLGKIYSEYWYILLAYLLLRTYALSYTTIHTLFVALGQVKLEFYYTLLANIAYVVITYLAINKIGIWAILLGMTVQYISSIQLKRMKIVKICYNTGL